MSRKIRVRERKTSDWDYKRYFEVESWKELMEYLRGKYYRWVVQFLKDGDVDVVVELYDTWRE
jgi:hypothetical protein